MNGEEEENEHASGDFVFRKRTSRRYTAMISLGENREQAKCRVHAALYYEATYMLYPLSGATAIGSG